jgi:hypothetical protein
VSSYVTTKSWLVGVHGVIRGGDRLGASPHIHPNVHDVQTNQHLKLIQEFRNQGRECRTAPNISTQSKRGWLGVHGVMRGGDRLAASPHQIPNHP